MPDLQTCFPGEAPIDGVVVINQSTTVAASADRVFAVVRDHGSFPRFTGDELIKLYEPLADGMSRWEISVDGCALSWVQRTFADSGNREVGFCRVDGDFETWEGAFQVVATHQGTKLSLVFRCAAGIPVIDDILKPAIEEKMGAFAQKLLAALKAAAEAV